jgi:hypothetical protein
MSSTIEKAIESVERAELRSIRATALAYDVHRNTLTRRLNGGYTCSQGHSGQQLLSIGQEEMLVDWILEQERLGHAPTHQRVHEFAAKIRGYSGEDPHVGHHWLTRFMKRNPAIKMKIRRKINY